MTGQETLPDGMRWEEFSGKVEEYQGKKLDVPIPYSGRAAVYINATYAKNSEDWPNESGVLKTVNTRRVTSAKAAAYQDATKSLKDAYEKTWDFAYYGLIKSAVAAGFEQDEAEAMALSRKDAWEKKQATKA